MSPRTVTFNPKHRRRDAAALHATPPEALRAGGAPGRGVDKVAPAQLFPQLSPGLETERLHPASAHRVPPGGRGRREPQSAPAPLSRVRDVVAIAGLYLALFVSAFFFVSVFSAFARALWAALSAAPAG